MTLLSDAAPSTFRPADPISPRPSRPDGGGEPRLPYHPGLDGLRALALIGVLCLHGGFAWARGGFLWVSTFFTLSGFLITSLAMAEHGHHGRISLGGFWARRARRLLPAALVTLLLAAAYGAWLADASQLEHLRGDGLAALLDVANWRFVLSDSSYASLFASPSPVQHFWSLAIEEQWYLLFPLAVVAALRLGRGRWPLVGALFALVAAAGMAWTLHLQAGGAEIERLYYGTDTRAAELALGVVLAVVVGHWRPAADAAGRWATRLAPLAFVVMLALTATVEHTDRWLYPVGLAAWAVLSGVLIVAAVQPDGDVARGLGVRPLRWLGTRSYGGYLLHWLVFLALDELLGSLARVPRFAVQVVVTLLLAELLFRLVEQPIRRRRALTARQAWVVLPVAMLAVAAALVVVTANPPEPEVSLGGPPMTRPAVVAPRASRVLVVGDSQASVLGQGLARWAEAAPDRASVWNVAVEGCGIVRGGEVEGWEGALSADCAQWPTDWTAALDEYRPDVVLVLSGPWDWVPRRLPGWDDARGVRDPDFDAHLVAEYEAAARLLVSRGARVVWLTSPCSEWQGFTGEDPAYVNQVLLPRVVAAVAGVELFDLHAELCPDGRFTDQLGGLADARPDGIHLSDEAADWVASWLMPAVLPPAAGAGGGSDPDFAAGEG